MKLFNKIRKAHKLANQDAVSIAFSIDDNDTSRLTKVETATHSNCIINPLVTPLIYLATYATLFTVYSFQAIRGNLK